MDDGIYPTGQCKCVGESYCTWCFMDSWRARMEKVGVELTATLVAGRRAWIVEAEAEKDLLNREYSDNASRCRAEIGRLSDEREKAIERTKKAEVERDAALARADKIARKTCEGDDCDRCEGFGERWIVERDRAIRAEAERDAALAAGRREGINASVIAANRAGRHATTSLADVTTAIRDLLNPESEEPLARIHVDGEDITDALHPHGACTCYGEGRCTWCVRSKEAIERVEKTDSYDLKTHAIDIICVSPVLGSADLSAMQGELQLAYKAGTQATSDDELTPWKIERRERQNLQRDYDKLHAEVVRLRAAEKAGGV